MCGSGQSPASPLGALWHHPQNLLHQGLVAGGSAVLAKSWCSSLISLPLSVSWFSRLVTWAFKTSTRSLDWLASTCWCASSSMSTNHRKPPGACTLSPASSPFFSLRRIVSWLKPSLGAAWAIVSLSMDASLPSVGYPGLRGPYAGLGHLQRPFTCCSQNVAVLPW